MIENFKSLNGAIIENITSYNEKDVKEGEMVHEDDPYRLVVETNEGDFIYEGSDALFPKMTVTEVKKLYIVGKIDKEDKKRWELQGIFDSEDMAVEECKDEFYFVGPVKLNKKYPESPIEWTGLYYPIVKTKHLNWNKLMGEKQIREEEK